MALDWYDMLMIAVLVLATLFGAWKGMAWQLASLASFVVSYFVALRFSDQLAPMFGESAPFNRFVAMLVIYLVTSAVIWMAFRLVAGILDRIRLRDFDHQIGALFGLAKGALLCLAITFFIVGLAPSIRDHVLNTHSGRALGVMLAKAEAIMPPEIHQVLDPYLNKIEHRLDPNKPFEGGSPEVSTPGAITPSQAGAADGTPTNQAELFQQTRELLDRL